MKSLGDKVVSATRLLIEGFVLRMRFRFCNNILLLIWRFSDFWILLIPVLFSSYICFIKNTYQFVCFFN